MAYQTYAKAISPIGTAGSFTKLSTPDDYNNELAYKVTLIVNPEDEGAAAFISAVEGAANTEFSRAQAELDEVISNSKGAAIAKAKQAKEELTLHTGMGIGYEDDGTPNGLVTFNMKRKAAGVYKSGRNEGKAWTQKIIMVDAAKKPIPDGVEVSDGSQLRVQVELMPFTATGIKKSGVSLKILAVQVSEVVSGYSGGSGDAFDTIEGGFVAPEAQAAVSTEPAFVPASADDDDIDF